MKRSILVGVTRTARVLSVGVSAQKKPTPPGGELVELDGVALGSTKANDARSVVLLMDDIGAR